eukprot:14307429-Alexandrium_andersonii.AAC.1
MARAQTIRPESTNGPPPRKPKDPSFCRLRNARSRTFAHTIAVVRRSAGSSSVTQGVPCSPWPGARGRRPET